ncbi:MAG: hypothetical protein IJO33_00335 [Bacilli bacterium]|nr:hypothetical protein [Bacilli bacterium]MBQ9853944.1 hypothetical protein [Bacilli bacterium]
MKKKILPFILVFIILIVCSIFIFYVFKDNKNDIPTTDVINKENVVNDSINTSSDKDVILETQDEEKQIIHDVDNEDEKTTSEKQETTNQTTNKNDVVIKEDVSSNNKEEVPPIDNNQSDDKIIVDETTDNSNDSTEEKEETSDSLEDQEFERLQSLIKYKTDKECYDASFDVTLEYMEDENFKVISCISYAYKGRLVGYRMIVHYWDGTTKYLDAID